MSNTLRTVYGAIEAGGAKFVCGVGTGPEDLQSVRIPTTSPAETVAAAVAWLRQYEVRAVGIGSFGPVDLDHESATFGHITRTPKAGWRNYDLAGAVRRALGVRVGFNTDVNAAALAESRWGAGRGVADFLYVTVGSGIGGGAFVSGRLLHGATHPEMGHIRIPHDWVRDPYAGACPFHGDCLEGLASGPAIEGRWRRAAADLPDDHPAWELEAHYLAHWAGELCVHAFAVADSAGRRRHAAATSVPHDPAQPAGHSARVRGRAGRRGSGAGRTGRSAGGAGACGDGDGGAGSVSYAHTIGGVKHRFDDLKTLLARATPARSGDDLAGIVGTDGRGARGGADGSGRSAAERFPNELVIPYETDEVTRLIVDEQDRARSHTSRI